MLGIVDVGAAIGIHAYADLADVSVNSATVESKIIFVYKTILLIGRLSSMEFLLQPQQ